MRLIDFGLVVLIWLVQLVIYPSFLYYDKIAMVKWHGPYTTAITLVVMPLMVGQLILHVMSAMGQPTLWNVITLLLVLGTWGVTFFVSVPLHNKIAAGLELTPSIEKLIATNWIRTILWSLVFLVTFFSQYASD